MCVWPRFPPLFLANFKKQLIYLDLVLDSANQNNFEKCYLPSVMSMLLIAICMAVQLFQNATQKIVDLDKKILF